MHLIFLMATQAIIPEPMGAEGNAGVGGHPFTITSKVDRCGFAESGGEIIVCGQRGTNERYRIPAEFRNQWKLGDRIGGIGSASLDAGAAVGPCGIFQGQKKCDKAEAAEFGWAAGRDPITAAQKVISALTDPE